jgi:4-oxalocrotonate tautomerase
MLRRLTRHCAKAKAILDCPPQSVVAISKPVYEQWRSHMPFVSVSIYEGRSLDQKRELAKGITEVVSRVTGVPPEGVHVVIDEVKRENWSIGGLLWPDRQPT